MLWEWIESVCVDWTGLDVVGVDRECVCRLDWLGHVVGVDREWTVRKLGEGKPEGGR